MTHYLRPTALCDSPQSEEGDALRLAGGLVYASRFALIEREDGKIVSRQRLARHEIEANLAFARGLQLEGTPAWVIGDQLMTGAVGKDLLAKAIAEEKAKS